MISIYNVQLGGLFEVSPNSILCEGNLLTLNLSTGDFEQPAEYEWYSNQSSQILSTLPLYSPTISGLYGLKVYDGNGCSTWIENWQPVTFIKAPIAQINGPTAVCVNNDFQLEGCVGAGYRDWEKLGALDGE